jgi:hypothetical protein
LPAAGKPSCANCRGEEIELWTATEVQTPNNSQQPENMNIATDAAKSLSIVVLPGDTKSLTRRCALSRDFFADPIISPFFAAN